MWSIGKTCGTIRANKKGTLEFGIHNDQYIIIIPDEHVNDGKQVPIAPASTLPADVVDVYKQQQVPIVPAAAAMLGKLDADHVLRVHDTPEPTTRIHVSSLSHACGGMKCLKKQSLRSPQMTRYRW